MGKLIINLVNGKRIQRTRPNAIHIRNTKRADGRVIAEFFDDLEGLGVNGVPFAECPANVIKTFRIKNGIGYLHVSTFAR